MNTSHRFPHTKSALLVLLALNFLVITARAESVDVWKIVFDSLADEKGKRVVDFLFYEPIHVRDGESANGNSELICFDEETDDMHKSMRAKFKETVGDKLPLRPSFFANENRESIRSFYDGLKTSEGKANKLVFLREIAEAMNRKSSENQFETIVYTYLNDTEVTVFVYDVTKPTEFDSGRKPYSPSAGPESRRSTVRNALQSALVNAFGLPPL